MVADPHRAQGSSSLGIVAAIVAVVLVLFAIIGWRLVRRRTP
jgi:hypothetical protein